MDKSKQRAVQFLEKEIKTYKALALFLSKGEIKKHQQIRNKENFTLPAYYKERMGRPQSW